MCGLPVALHRGKRLFLRVLILYGKGSERHIQAIGKYDPICSMMEENNQPEKL